jgi:hypothetical protein
MCAPQRLQHLRPNPHSTSRVESTFTPQAGTKVFARQQLHDQKRQALLAPTGVEDLDDVRALCEAGGFRFPLKTHSSVGISRRGRRQKLQRDALPDAGVCRLKHGTHPAAPDEPVDVVLAATNDPTSKSSSSGGFPLRGSRKALCPLWIAMPLRIAGTG